MRAAGGGLARRLPPREEHFTSSLRGREVAARVGVWLGACFTIAFLTGVWSHLYQDQPAWLTIPTGPVWLYRVTQGLHYLTGTAAVPLLLVKLYAVYPKLFQRVPFGRVRELVLHLLERLSIAVLVAAAVFELATGIANSAQFYPWTFPFRDTHFALAWVVIGALVLHVAVKLPVIRDAFSRPIDEDEDDDRDDDDRDDDDRDDDDRTGGGSGGLTRRGLVRTAVGASGVAVLTVAGGTVPWLRRVSVFETHSGAGPDGLPINKSAARARVVALATDPSYALEVVHGGRTRTLGLADLKAMPQHTEELPIACVEGWSASGEWTGVRVRDLLALVDAPAGTTVRVSSLQPHGPFRSSELRANYVEDDRTLLALRLNGHPLALDHGYPARLIAPNRPGVLQTKWVGRIEVV